MNRLKFRVWDHIYNVFYYADLNNSVFSERKHWENGASLIPKHIKSSLELKFINEKDNIPKNKLTIPNLNTKNIQQSTALLDENDREIYEGDILKYDGICDITYDKPGEVSFGEYFNGGGKDKTYHYGLRVKRIDMENAYFGLNSKESKGYLIIGNIFETPELLKTN